MSPIKKDTFEITAQTLALVATATSYGKVLTEVIETGARHELPVHPSRLVDEACRYFASSLPGRLAGTKQVAGFTHKPPIVISQSMGIYFFPTISPKRKDCSWISHSHIRSFDSLDGYQTTIEFTNGSSIVVPVSPGMIANQIQRTAQFRFLLENRIKHSSLYTAEQIAEPFA
ncbi:competence transcription factor [Thalassobacillus devorans]|uniref:Competence transcription factor n=1 Tax=Thalassobacillus devorans TaxID=279813 RepID=A0ABQ1NHH9_9BACI|nr:competence protein ComK [Thalassobacillus devorans]NIK27001.1 competence protein ComK [Thalassobacillus devorans]GGC74113.1 competence transcription factor [Thalassobacillus devorans]